MHHLMQPNWKVRTLGPSIMNAAALLFIAASEGDKLTRTVSHSCIMKSCSSLRLYLANISVQSPTYSQPARQAWRAALNSYHDLETAVT